MVVFAVILAVLIGLSRVLLIELSNIHSSGVLAAITSIAPIFVLGIAGVIVWPLFYGRLLAIYRAEVYYRGMKNFRLQSASKTSYCCRENACLVMP
jgi:hypothetical protein